MKKFRKLMLIEGTGTEKLRESVLSEGTVIEKFKKFMLHNGDMIGALYFGTPITFMLVLPLLIGVITDSGFVCYLAILVGMVLSLALIPVINKIVDRYIIGE